MNWYWVLRKKNAKKNDPSKYIEQYSHGLSYTTFDHALKFFKRSNAVQAQSYIAKEFHVRVLIDAHIK